jgi:hypothetical protein
MGAFLGEIPPILTHGTHPASHKKYSKYNNGHWLFPEQLGGEEHVGFIYVIRDNVLRRFYLGKKLFRGCGKLNKGVESNWKKYESSSTILKDMFKERPREEFDFIVLEQYRTKGTLSYSETFSLCLVEAPTSNNWYNTRIESVSWNVKEPISKRHKERLQRTTSWSTFEE